MDHKLTLAFMQEAERRRKLKDYASFSHSYLKIINKEKKQCPLVLNSVQKEINDIIEEKNAKGEPVRLIILKARQEGVSTFFQGRIMHAATTRENVNGLVVAHRDDSTTAIFEKSKYMYDNLPEDIKPIKKASNAKELIFDTPSNYTGDKKGLNSKIRIQTAGSAGIGRSDTFNYAHLSEFGLWEGKDDKSPANQLSGIMDAIPDVAGTEVIIESTAFGYNDFKTIWDDAVAGKNSWTPLFFPWWKHDEYITEFKNEEEKQDFINTMSDYEKYLLNDLKLSMERINWWRNKLKSKNNDINTMKQENPSTPEEAFLMSGTPVFNNDIVMKRIEVLRQKYEKYPFKSGYFEFEWNNPEHKDFIKKDTIKFIESNSKAWIRIYKEPKNYNPYVLAGDTKGEGSDYYAGQMMDNVTTERVATIHMQVNNSKPYTWQMYCLGLHYNEALIGIEMNFNTAPIEELERLKYPNQYVRQKQDDYTKGYLTKLGWKTDGITRPLIIDKQIYVVENHIQVFNDIETLQEHITFVYDKNNRPDAMSGKHDDLLMADMILNEIRTQQRMDAIVKEYDINWSKVPQDYREDYNNASDEWKKIMLDDWRKKGLFK